MQREKLSLKQFLQGIQGPMDRRDCLEVSRVQPKHPLKRTNTWRIIPVSKWLVTPIYKPFRPFIRGITPFRGLTITMVINHVSKSWDGPPSSALLKKLYTEYQKAIDH